MMLRQKFSVDYLVCWYAEEQVTEAWVQSIWSLISVIMACRHHSPAAGANVTFACTSWLMQSLTASSDWPPRVWCHGSWARRKAPAASTVLLRLPESPTKPGPPSAGDPGNTGQMDESGLWHSPAFKKEVSGKSTDQDVTSSLLLPFEAVPDLAHCHVTFFLKEKNHTGT